MLTRRHFLSLASASALVPTIGWASPVVDVLGGSAFGSYWRLSVPNGSYVSQAEMAAIIEATDRTFSPFRLDSELSTFNRIDTADWLPCTQALSGVLETAISIGTRTGGAYDPTIGPLVHRYGFGPIEAPVWGHYEQIRTRAGAIGKDDGGLSIDLCGIVKGYALDEMASALMAGGVSDFMLDLGGEICAQGRHPAGRSWQVAVESLDGRYPVIVAPNGRAIATSGVTAQSYGIGGQMVSHIINPHSESATLGEIVTASVLSNSAMLADGWATAIVAMPLDQALQLANDHGLDALMFMRDGDVLRPVMTGEFSDYVVG